MEAGLPEADNLSRIKHKTEEEEEKGANGGVLNNLISNLIGTTTTTTVNDKSGENIPKSECEDGDHEKKKESSGAGILENIISHLPADDIEVPTTQEASMLIHSVID
ncbi:PREDICTED: uncharacterized protein LOC106301969 isoform X1 [Brassica oleracea var. oleracea]|uniref:uncharacterized protein LOC106301969 isoform X1 n=1 Tax=Brassica oleracea var. oleracea TaxID=109376 RepID=UPI0006A739CC|nr:PREDICTED: uncharacterized protein LOC106301969 isoform X1 [Brassica oleracea var. oleracea]